MKVQNYGEWRGDRRGGHHPPACTCYACNEQRNKDAAAELAATVEEGLRKAERAVAPENSQHAQPTLEPAPQSDPEPDSEPDPKLGPAPSSRSRQAAPIRNLSPRPTDQTTQWPTPPQPSKPTEAQQEQQPQRGPRQAAPIRNLSPRPSDLTSQPPKPPEVRQGGQRPTPLQPPTTAGARQRPQQSRRNPRGNNLLKLVIPAALAVAVLGCAILLLG